MKRNFRMKRERAMRNFTQKPLQKIFNSEKAVGGEDQSLCIYNFPPLTCHS